MTCGSGGGMAFLSVNLLKYNIVDAKHSINSAHLRETRKHLRTHSTSAEAELWKYLSGKKLFGRKFRRQYSIDNYIIDFYCVSEKLAIELDGDPHGDYIQIQKDIIRDEYLNKAGIKTIRIQNRFVFQNPEYVKQLIVEAFRKDMTYHPPAPASPDPSF
jgi:very-short-patch-repair endonuclease